MNLLFFDVEMVSGFRASVTMCQDITGANLEPNSKTSSHTFEYIRGSNPQNTCHGRACWTRLKTTEAPPQINAKPSRHHKIHANFNISDIDLVDRTLGLLIRKFASRYGYLSPDIC